MYLQSQMRICVSLAVVLVTLLVNQEQTSALEIPRLVETGPSKLFPGGTHVGVNVPLIFNMDMDTRPKHTGVKMDLSVLKGLVHVFLDRQRNASGSNEGPIQVDIEGMSVYNNQA